MIVHKNIHDLPAFRNAVITIGTFDGVHTGHQQIIQLMKTEAKQIGGETVIITFHPHPRRVISGKKSPLFLLNTLDEKVLLLERFGIDHLVVVPFTEDFAGQSAEQYISEFLIAIFHPHTIIIGHDHRFGKGRAGNYRLLEEKATENNYIVKEIPEHMLHDSTISSTKIREALQKGDVDTAKAYLGADYFFTGKVVEGNKLGRTIGYPTANIHVEDETKLIPGDGVYAVELIIGEQKGKIFDGMMNIGIRPTINGSARRIEVNIFDFDADIYGSSLTVTVKKRLRDEQKFNGLEGLKVQLAQDKTDALTALRSE